MPRIWCISWLDPEPAAYTWRPSFALSVDSSYHTTEGQAIQNWILYNQSANIRLPLSAIHHRCCRNWRLKSDNRLPRVFKKNFGPRCSKKFWPKKLEKKFRKNRAKKFEKFQSKKFQKFSTQVRKNNGPKCSKTFRSKLLRPKKSKIFDPRLLKKKSTHSVLSLWSSQSLIRAHWSKALGNLYILSLLGS